MRRLGALLVAVTVALGLGVAVATPAHANIASCGLNRICYWTGTNYNGSGQEITPRKGTCKSPVVFDNEAESFYNNRNGGHIQLYSGPNCTDYLLRDTSGFAGPFQAGHHANILLADRNKLTSIWINSDGY